MKHIRTAVAVTATIVLFVAACVAEPGLDKQKFAELHRTVQDVKTAVASAAPCDAPEDLEQKLAAAIAAVKDRTSSQEERNLVAACSRLLDTYRDGLLLCRSRTLLANFPFLPKGRIYVSQHLDPVVEKYGLQTEKHLYKPTGQYWKSVDANAINVIRGVAHAQIRNIENIVKYN